MTDLPPTMKAMVLAGHGGLDRYEWHEDWPTPSPGPDDVVIRVGARGLDNTDVNTRTGWYARAVADATGGEVPGEIGEADPTWGGRALTFPRIQGADVVGRAMAVGANADPALIGKQVMVDGRVLERSDPGNKDRTGCFGSERRGGLADYTMADRRDIAVIENPLPDAELATFQCSYTTAEGMLARADVGASDTVLVPGASGGVGGALIQLARRRGARVIALASHEKHEDVARFGPDRVLPRAPENLRAALGDEKITVVADVVGGPLWPELIGVLERAGRYTCSGAIAGPLVPLDLRTLHLGDLTFFGSTVIPRKIFRDVVLCIERGEIRPVLAASYPLSRLCEAQAAFIARTHAGNIVVIP